MSDVLANKKLPRAIRAGQAWKGSGPDSSVDANELLLVRGTKTKLKTKYLKVFSPAANKKKVLPEHCIGRFSTRPYDVRVYLPEIVHHLKDPFPLQAVLFINSETAQDIPVFLMSSIITLKSQSVDTSLIATSTLNDDISKGQIVDIPFDLDIEVSIVFVLRLCRLSTYAQHGSRCCMVYIVPNLRGAAPRLKDCLYKPVLYMRYIARVGCVCIAK